MVLMEDVLGSWPDVPCRINTIEKQTCPKLANDIGDMRTAVKDIQRKIGDDQGFTLKANRAFAADTPAGNAASVSHRGEEALPMPSAQPMPAPAPDDEPQSITADLAADAPLYRPEPSVLLFDTEALEQIESRSTSVVIKNDAVVNNNHEFHSVRLPAATGESIVRKDLEIPFQTTQRLDLHYERNEKYPGYVYPYRLRQG